LDQPFKVFKVNTKTNVCYITLLKQPKRFSRPMTANIALYKSIAYRTLSPLKRSKKVTIRHKRQQVVTQSDTLFNLYNVHFVHYRV